MHTKKAVRLVGVVIVVGVAILAALVYQRTQNARQWIASIEESRRYAERADAAYRATPTSNSVSDVREYLEYLERLSPSSEPWTTSKHPLLGASLLAVERTLAASRLAMLEDRLGNMEAAEGYWTRAERHAVGTQLEEENRASLRELVQRLNANGERDTRSPG